MGQLPSGSWIRRHLYFWWQWRQSWPQFEAPATPLFRSSPCPHYSCRSHDQCSKDEQWSCNHGHLRRNHPATRRKGNRENSLGNFHGYRRVHFVEEAHVHSKFFFCEIIVRCLTVEQLVWTGADLERAIKLTMKIGLSRNDLFIMKARRHPSSRLFFELTSSSAPRVFTLLIWSLILKIHSLLFRTPPRVVSWSLGLQRLWKQTKMRLLESITIQNPWRNGITIDVLQDALSETKN